MASQQESLIDRFVARGISHAQIPGLIRNVFGIVGDGGLFTTQLVNEQLEKLGWGSEVLDETIFQLIVYILETQWGYRVRHYNIGQIEMRSGGGWTR